MKYLSENYSGTSRIKPAVFLNFEYNFEKTMKQIIIILAIMPVFLHIQAQVPQWADENYRLSAFPRNQFYIGYAEQIVGRNEDSQKALDNTLNAAKGELSEEISVTIKSKSVILKKELVKNIENNKLDFDYNSVFDSWTSSTSENTLCDLQQMEPVYDKKTDRAYAFVYLEKSKLLLKNQQIIDMNLLKISTAIKNAELYIEQSKELDALELLMRTVAAFNEIERSQSQVFSISDQPYKLEDFLDKNNTIFNLTKHIENSTDLSIEESCKLAVEELRRQLNSRLNLVVVLNKINYENSEFTSPFSQRFQKELGRHMILNNFQMANSVTDAIKIGEYVEATGEYFVEGGVIRVYITMIGKPSGKEFASATSLVSKSWLGNNEIAFIPDRIKDREIVKDTLDNATGSGNIELRIWTNKLASMPIFEEGESMKLYIQVDKPCWVRGLYFQADGLTTNAFKDFQILTSDIGKIIDLEERGIAEFVMGAPFGKEDMMIAVSEKPFSKLNIEVRDVIVAGQTYKLHAVKDDDLTAIAVTKGLINKRNTVETENPAYYGQKHIQLMVVPKGE